MTIQGTPGPDTLNGTEGTDIFFPLLGDDLVFGGGGNDEIHARDSLTPAGVSEGDDSFYGQSGNDLLNASGGLGRHLLDGGDGLDTLYGGLGNDLLTGGSGDDALWDQVSGTDTLLGGAGNDHLSTYASLGNDSLDGGSGDDTLEGGTGSDTLTGGDDNDTLWDQGSGRDTLLGGGGSDYLSTYSSRDEDLLDGGPGNDSLFGGTASDTLIGGDGNDSLNGYEGNDSLDGGAGVDTLFGGAGSDSLTGGDDNDSLWDQGAGRDTLLGGGGDDYLSTYTSRDEDLLDGGPGNDSLFGGTASDTLIGGDGNDSLNGDEGNDSLDGGAGVDTLLGGAGDDTYRISSRHFSLYDSGGKDASVVSVNFVKLPSTIESVVYVDGAQALPYWIDALVTDNGAHISTLVGSAKTYHYAYPTSLPAYDSTSSHALGYLAFNNDQKAFSALAMGYLASVVDLHFVATNNVSDANTILFANNVQANSAGYATSPSDRATGSDLFLDSTTDGNLTPRDGEYAALTLIHELGHALGLKHPFSDPDAYGDVDLGPYLPATEDNTTWTVMSYSENRAQYHLAYSALDLAALQYLYGPSPAARADDSTYVVNTAGSHFIWDGAGNDTLDASAQTQPLTLYLSPGYWGYVGAKAETITAPGQVTVNFGTMIEGLKGGSGNDFLVGNESDNTITGGAGNDTLSGSLGNDSLSGGLGIDTAQFSGARSSYVLGMSQTNWTVTGTDGIDTLIGIEFAQFLDQRVSLSNSAPTGSVTIKGSAIQGQTLSISNTLSDLDGLGFISYQWSAGGSAISGATASTFLITTAQAGKAITVTASYTDGQGTAESSTSNALAVPVSTQVDILAYTWKNHTLLADVSVSNSSLALVTATDGATSFEAIPGQPLTITASRPVPAAEASLTSSAVNLQDAIAILKMIVGLDVNGAGKPLSPYQALAADFDGNGVVQLTDAIGVLKHVVGLTAPQPTWHFVNELDATVPGKANLNPGLPQTSISANTGGSNPVRVGLVGYLGGDVDGSFAGAAGALDLDALQSGYFTSLTAASGLNLTQFGVYGA